MRYFEISDHVNKTSVTTGYSLRPVEKRELEYLDRFVVQFHPDFDRGEIHFYIKMKRRNGEHQTIVMTQSQQSFLYEYGRVMQRLSEASPNEVALFLTIPREEMKHALELEAASNPFRFENSYHVSEHHSKNSETTTYVHWKFKKIFKSFVVRLKDEFFVNLTEKPANCAAMFSMLRCNVRVEPSVTKQSYVDDIYKTPRRFKNSYKFLDHQVPNINEMLSIERSESHVNVVMSDIEGYRLDDPNLAYYDDKILRRLSKTAFTKNATTHRRKSKVAALRARAGAGKTDLIMALHEFTRSDAVKASDAPPIMFPFANSGHIAVKATLIVVPKTLVDTTWLLRMKMNYKENAYSCLDMTSESTHAAYSTQDFLKADYVLVSFDYFELQFTGVSGGKHAKTTNAHHLMNFHWKRVVFDEAHKIWDVKSPNVIIQNAMCYGLTTDFIWLVSASFDGNVNHPDMEKTVKMMMMLSQDNFLSGRSDFLQTNQFEANKRHFRHAFLHREIGYGRRLKLTSPIPENAVEGAWKIAAKRLIVGGEEERQNVPDEVEEVCHKIDLLPEEVLMLQSSDVKNLQCWAFSFEKSSKCFADNKTNMTLEDLVKNKKQEHEKVQRDIEKLNEAIRDYGAVAQASHAEDVSKFQWVTPLEDLELGDFSFNQVECPNFCNVKKHMLAVTDKTKPLVAAFLEAPTYQTYNAMIQSPDRPYLVNVLSPAKFVNSPGLMHDDATRKFSKQEGLKSKAKSLKAQMNQYANRQEQLKLLEAEIARRNKLEKDKEKRSVFEDEDLPCQCAIMTEECTGTWNCVLECGHAFCRACISTVEPKYCATCGQRFSTMYPFEIAKKEEVPEQRKKYGSKIWTVATFLQEKAKAKESSVMFIKWGDLTKFVVDTLKSPEFGITVFDLSNRRTDRLKAYANFLDTPGSVMILTMGEQTTGINLQAAKHCVFFHALLNDDGAKKMRMQCISRIDREGSPHKKIYVHDFIISKSMEEELYETRTYVAARPARQNEPRAEPAPVPAAPLAEADDLPWASDEEPEAEDTDEDVSDDELDEEDA